MVIRQPDDLIYTVVSEASCLHDFLSRLSPETWVSDSTSEGWTIEDVVAHLSGNIDNWTRNLIRAVAGNTSPPEGQAYLAAGDRASHPRGPIARASRSQTGPQLLDEFIKGHESFRKVLESLTEDDWGKPCFHRRGILTVRMFIGLQVQELAIHGWDIRSGFDNEAKLSEISLPVLIDLIPRWINTAFTPQAELPTPVIFRFEVSGPIGVRQDLTVTSGGYQMELVGKNPADVIFRCNTSNYILMMYGRLEVERAIADGRLTVEGSGELANTFNSWFKGF